MPDHEPTVHMRLAPASALGLLSVLLLTGGCSSSVSDLTTPTSDFWDRRPCVAGVRASPYEGERREPPPREFVQRQAPRDCAPPVAQPSFPTPQPRATAPRTMTAPPRMATSQPRRSSVNAPASTEEMRVLEQVNRIRAQHSLRALRFQPTLWTAARDHSKEQDQHGFMGHGSPDPSRRELGQRMALAGYRGRVYAEVVAWGYPDVASVVEGWMNSTEHRRILLDAELTEGAFSRIGQYWTGNFGAPSRLAPVSAPRAPSRAAPRAAPRATPVPRASRPRRAAPAPRKRVTAPRKRVTAPIPTTPKQPSGFG